MRDDGGGSAAVSGQPISAHLSEFAIELRLSEVDTAGILTVHNGGTMAHNVGIRGTDILSADLAAGESAELDLSELGPGTYEVYLRDLRPCRLGNDDEPHDRSGRRCRRRRR